MKTVLMFVMGSLFAVMAVRINNDATTITNLSLRVHQLESRACDQPYAAMNGKSAAGKLEFYRVINVLKSE